MRSFLCGVVLVGVVSGSSFGQITYVSQSRTASAFSHVPSPGTNGGLHSIAATDFAPFHQTVTSSSTYTGIPNGSDSASATINSDLLADAIVMTGSSTGRVILGGGSMGGYSINGGTLLTLRFTIDTPQQFTFDGAYQILPTIMSGPATYVHMSVQGPSGFSPLVMMGGSRSLTTSGDLPAGTYDVLIDVSGLSDGLLAGFDTNYSFDFHVMPPPCPADFNGDGNANSQDFFDFLVAFFSQDPVADLNHDGDVNSQDFFAFVTLFFAGC